MLHPCLFIALHLQNRERVLGITRIAVVVETAESKRSITMTMVNIKQYDVPSMMTKLSFG